MIKALFVSIFVITISETSAQESPKDPVLQKMTSGFPGLRAYAADREVVGKEASAAYGKVVYFWAENGRYPVTLAETGYSPEDQRVAVSYYKTDKNFFIKARRGQAFFAIDKNKNITASSAPAVD